ncbi:MAG: hypothetical protein K0R18_321 [Bacillales bacterium]|jgi:exosome complex RNA-binding protein Rrp4|nr:hypothetical protein [Bacillales bacterium]
MNTKQQFDALEKVVNIFQKFDGKPVAQVRKELSNTIKKLETGKLSWMFARKDDIKTKRVKLWAYANCMAHNMHPDIEIGVDENGKVWVQNDILWKTMYGLQEQMQEEEAYEYKYGRD